MSFINISDPKNRDEIFKSYLAIKKRIQQRNINEKFGDMAQSEDRQKMCEPIIKSNIQAEEEISKDLVPIRKELEQFNQEFAFGLAAQDPQKCYNSRGNLPTEEHQNGKSQQSDWSSRSRDENNTRTMGYCSRGIFEVMHTCSRSRSRSRSRSKLSPN